MRRLTTDREAHVLELAGRLADRFAERAGEHDRDNTFPAENWPVLAAEGYLGLAVPAELGGFDADAGELLLAQERLAQGCGATALAVDMHLTTASSLRSLWRAGEGKLERADRHKVETAFARLSKSLELGKDTLIPPE